MGLYNLGWVTIVFPALLAVFFYLLVKKVTLSGFVYNYIRRGLFGLVFCVLVALASQVDVYVSEKELSNVLTLYPNSVLDNIDFRNNAKIWWYSTHDSKEKVIEFYENMASLYKWEFEEYAPSEHIIHARGRRFRIMVFNARSNRRRIIKYEDLGYTMLDSETGSVLEWKN